jgi:uncharacterized protein YdbL (DUF1318 family)
MRSAIAILAVLLAVSCTIKPPELAITSEKTALENQIMGSYARITEDVWMVASARGPENDSAGVTIDEDRMRAVRAMQRQLFNADEVEEFLEAGAFGEGNDGFLVAMEEGMDALEPRTLRVAETVLREENLDRRVLMERVIEVNDNLTEADFSAVQATFAARSRDAAAPGTWVQTNEGTWVRKQGAAAG